jgi:hypothetical protein
LFTLPYDFRQDSRHSDVAVNFERTVKYAYHMSGEKKVVLITHSFGNLNAL